MTFETFRNDNEIALMILDVPNGYAVEGYAGD